MLKYYPDNNILESKLMDKQRSINFNVNYQNAGGTSATPFAILMGIFIRRLIYDQSGEVTLV